MADKSNLNVIATMLGVGGTAEKIIKKDVKNTKAGKKAGTIITK